MKGDAGKLLWTEGKTCQHLDYNFAHFQEALLAKKSLQGAPLLRAENLFFFFFVFLGPHPQRMEVPRLRVQLELQLPAYTTATAMWDLNLVFDLHHSSQQGRILYPLSVAWD